MLFFFLKIGQKLFVQDSGKAFNELKQEFNRLTDDEKRSLKVQYKEDNIKYYEDMQKWLDGLSISDREAYESSIMHNKGNVHFKIFATYIYVGFPANLYPRICI